MITPYADTKLKDSHEFAVRMKQIADYLLARDSFKITRCAVISDYDGKFSMTFDDKEEFVKAVKIVGDAKKSYTDGDYSYLQVEAVYAPIELKISRDKVCKKVVKFECEPLFSEEEVEAL